MNMEKKIWELARMPVAINNFPGNASKIDCYISSAMSL